MKRWGGDLGFYRVNFIENYIFLGFFRAATSGMVVLGYWWCQIGDGAGLVAVLLVVSRLVVVQGCWLSWEGGGWVVELRRETRG